MVGLGKRRRWGGGGAGRAAGSDSSEEDGSESDTSGATEDVLREEDDGLAELVLGGGRSDDEDEDGFGGAGSESEGESDSEGDDGDDGGARARGFGRGGLSSSEEEGEMDVDGDGLGESESELLSGSDGSDEDEDREDGEGREGRGAKGRAKAGRGREVKGDPVHVRGQLLLWDKALDARIRLQRAVGAANRLPASRQALEAMVDHAPRGTRDALAGLRAGARATLGAVLGLLGAVQAQAQAQAGEAPSAAEKIGPDTTLESLDALLADQLRERLDFACVDEWNRVANAASGAYSAKQFKAMNQDVTEQVAQTLARSRIKLVAKVQERKQESKPALCAGLGLPDDVVDDTEFYSSLLREYLESQLAGGDANATKILASTLHAKKVRKNVDRRASKGRKLRYHVMEKLVGFMPAVAMHPPGGGGGGGYGAGGDDDDDEGGGGLEGARGESFERILVATLFGRGG